jgi:hypothetical protein
MIEEYSFHRNIGGRRNEDPDQDRMLNVIKDAKAGLYRIRTELFGLCINALIQQDISKARGYSQQMQECSESIMKANRKIGVRLEEGK